MIIGILQKATDAKTQTWVGQEKETIALAYNSALANKVSQGDLSAVNANDLNKEFQSDGTKATAKDRTNDIEITFDTGNSYTIDNVGNVSKKEIIPVANISLNPTEQTIDEGTEFIITATTDGNEDLKWRWEKISGESNLSIETSGESKKIAKIVAQGSGTTKIIAYTPNATSNECTLTIKSEYVDSSYVEYDVEYKDVYTEKLYTKNTGWRLLNQTQNANGTYNIDIISTGIPAKLYYDSDNIKSSLWAGSSMQRSNFISENYGNDLMSNVDYKGIYATSGLYYNFENIQFNIIGTKNTLDISSGKALYRKYNCGGYVDIKNAGNIPTSSSGRFLFRTSIASGTINKIRSVMIEDMLDVDGQTAPDIINGRTIEITDELDKRQGLFKLASYTPSPNYSGLYWIGTPSKSETNQMHCMYTGDSRIYLGSETACGVRPVISISNANMKLENHVWKIIQ